MKSLSFIFVVLLLGCQSPKLHLINYGYSAAKIESLKIKLAKNGITVIDADIEIPQEFTDAILSLNPGFSDFKVLEALHNSLNSLGFGPVVEYRFAEGRHFYTKNNIGLYLRNPEMSTLNPLPKYLRTQYCEWSDATLMFKPNGGFILEYEILAKENEVIETMTGKWIKEQTKLILFPIEGPIQTFMQSFQQKETFFGMKPADVYTPQEQHLLLPLNCEFLIIYGE